jgi:tetratricopeptide (TPR) repeat protein
VARAAPPGSRAEIDCQRIQSMIWLHRGRRSEAAESAEQAVALARGAGNDRMLLHCLLQLQLAAAALEDFARMLDVCSEMEQLAIDIQNPCFTLLAQIGQGVAELLFGHLAEAEAAFERALTGLGDGVGPALEAVAFGLGAQCALEQGRHSLAEERADAALQAVRSSRWAMQELRYALNWTLNVFMSVDRPERHAAQIQEALGRLRRLARMFPSAEPNAWVFEGRNEMRLGRPSRAASALRRSLRAASLLGSTCDRANAHYWLGRLAQTEGGRPLVPEGAAVHLEAAHTLFARQGVASEAARARAAWRSCRPPEPESERAARAPVTQPRSVDWPIAWTGWVG